MSRYFNSCQTGDEIVEVSSTLETVSLTDTLEISGLTLVGTVKVNLQVRVPVNAPAL